MGVGVVVGVVWWGVCVRVCVCGVTVYVASTRVRKGRFRLIFGNLLNNYPMAEGVEGLGLEPVADEGQYEG